MSRAYKPDPCAIEQACLKSTSDRPQDTKVLYLTRFIQAAAMTASKLPVPTSPPKEEYYPHIVDALMDDLEKNLKVLPTKYRPHDIVSNTIRFGAIAPKLVDDFSNLVPVKEIALVFKDRKHPEHYLQKLKDTFEKLRQDPDNALYTDDRLLCEAVKAIQGVRPSAKAAHNTAADTVVTHKQKKPLPDALVRRWLQEAGLLPIEPAAVNTPRTRNPPGTAGVNRISDWRARVGLPPIEPRPAADPPAQRQDPSAILQTFLSNSPEEPCVIAERVNTALGEDSRHVVTGWGDKVTGKGGEPKDKGR